jgi:CheY-like chemotaxis protein
VAADAWPVLGDFTQLHQVLLNLCLNARDAMQYGGTLTIAVENVPVDEHFAQSSVDATPGEYVMFTITDTGTGMTKEVMDRLFEPFFTTKGQGSGTGLGLATALGIVKSHGGFIKVYSEVGKGSTFKVFIPASINIENVESTPNLDESLQGNGELILIVDDEEVLRTVMTAALEKNGYATVMASDGAEAIAIYAQERDTINAVIIDMMMPVMDGFSTIRALRKIDPAIRIVGISGLGENMRNPEFAQAATCFLEKPFTTPKLLATIKDVLTVASNSD